MTSPYIYARLEVIKHCIAGHFNRPDTQAHHLVFASNHGDLYCNEHRLHLKMWGTGHDFWCVVPCRRYIDKPDHDLGRFTMLELARHNTSPYSCLNEVLYLVACITGHDEASAVHFDFEETAQKGRQFLKNYKPKVYTQAPLNSTLIQMEKQRLRDYRASLQYIMRHDSVRPGVLVVLNNMPPDLLLPAMAMDNERFEVYATVPGDSRLIELANAYYYNTDNPNRIWRGDRISDRHKKMVMHWHNKGTTVTDIGIGIERCLMVHEGLNVISSFEDVPDICRKMWNE